MDMMYALGDNAYGFFRMVTAGVLVPERIWTAVHLRVTDRATVDTLRKAADFRNNQELGISAIAELLVGKLTDPDVPSDSNAEPVYLDAARTKAEIGYARWAVSASPTYADITVRFGPCAYHWFGCPACTA